MSDRNPAPRFICRCEEVALDELERALANGARTINDVKRRTRAGMGACQGTYCLQHVAAIVSKHLGTPIELVAPMTVRPPVRWIALSTLAGEQSDNGD